jgi:peptidoglycan/LPS O-acetylase OafA/YrhL
MNWVNAKQGKRIFGLDLLRAWAILVIVYGHGSHFLYAFLPQRLVQLTVLDGVPYFFVLSGYLIGGILIRILETGRITLGDLGNFWKRRLFRILPSYYLILVVNLVLVGYPLNSVARYFFFTQNLTTQQTSFFPEAWNLSVEVWFYLLIPLLLFFIHKIFKKPGRSLVFTAFFFIIVSIVIRHLYYATLTPVDGSIWERVFRKVVITRLDCLAFGLLGAYFNHYHLHRWVKHNKICFITGIFLLVVHKSLFFFKPELGLSFNIYYCVYSFTLESVAVLMLFPFLSQYKTEKGLFYKWVTFLSLLSYAIYLLHLSFVQGFILPISMEFMAVSLSEPGIAMAEYLVYWIASLGGAFLLYRFFEQPLTGLRDVV